MEFIKKYWKYILLVLIYTVLVSFISISAYKSYLGNKINKTFEETFNTISDSFNNKENSSIENKDISNQIISTKPISLNETLTTQDWEITLIGTEFSQDVIPPTPDTFYSHYQVKDTTNTYLVVKLDMKNISTISLHADDNISLKAIYDGKYEYTGFSTLLAQDNSDFDYTNITSIAPLTKRTLYYLIEMPKDITVDDKNIEIQLMAYQDKYVYRISKTKLESDINSNNVTNKEVSNTNTTQISTNNSTTTKKSSNTTQKKETSESINPYEENVIYFYDAANSNDSQNSNSLDSYIKNNISNQPIPELPSNTNELNADFIIEGTGF